MAAVQTKLQLPTALAGARESLEKALNIPLDMTWPTSDAEKYLDAEQPHAIGKVLIGTLHRHLVQARIAYLFRPEISKAWAKASRASSKLQYLAEIDFGIEFDIDVYRRLSREQRIALVDHELCHCARDDQGKFVMLDHDVEEFAGIVHRWGAWRPSLRHFKGALSLAQIELPLDKEAA